MGPIKALWLGDGGCATGFANVNHSIISNLPAGKYEVHHIAINYFGDPVETAEWHKLYPAGLGGEPYGVRRINEVIARVKPDFVFLLQDLWMLSEYINVIPNDLPIVFYFPIDAGPLERMWVDNLERVAVPVVYTDFAKQMINNSLPGLDLRVIPHGVDLNTFFHIPMPAARKVLDGMKEDEWVVLNANRNQPRKRVDLTIKGFCRFANDKPDNVKLYLHMGLEDSFVRIDKMMDRYGEGERLTITSPYLSPSFSVPASRLNVIYNACNIGINTSLGEGWGLVSFEHAATGAPQIVPYNSANIEIYGDGRGLFMECDHENTITAPHIMTEGVPVTADEVATALQYAYDNPIEMAQRAAAMTEYINRDDFRWKTIARQWDAIFDEVRGK